MDIIEKEYARLLKENEELTNSLFFVNEKLRKSEKLKGHFISNITNEIINPFTSVMALAENIKKLGNNDIDTAKRMAGKIYDEAFQLDFQLKNIFAAAIIESGMEKIELVTINLDEFSRYIAHYFSTLLEKKAIKLNIELESNLLNEPTKDCFIKTDREKLDLIVMNLVSNAIKYSPNDSQIDLLFVVNNECLIINVLDNGIGIEPKNRKIIFDRFKQLNENINSFNTGHGLGLSVVLSYVELLNGNLSLDDNKNGGLAVVVELPLDINAQMGDLDDFLFESETLF